MHLDTDKTAIEAVLRSVRQGHYDKDPAAIGAQFAPEAVIFDLAPPLGHKLDVPGLAAWLDNWDGPVRQRRAIWPSPSAESSPFATAFARWAP
jgi:hypothetical protein